VSPGYSALQTARLVSALRWVCGRLSEILDAWAAEAAAAAGGAPSGASGAAAGAAAEMRVLSRRLDSHRLVLEGLQPDSERLAGWRQAAPADPSLTDALDEIAALTGPAGRLAVARDVLVPRLAGACRGICEHAAPHCDGALASAAGSLGHDLGHDRAGAAPLDGDANSSVAVAVAERVLEAAGGLVAPSVLRPVAFA
jgi:hypothetical protein